jgi:hypothetical protein
MLAQADDAPYLYAEMARRRLKQGVAAPAHGEKALIEEARRWNDARILRRYLHARQRCGEYPAGEWMAWARAVADRLDPAFEPRRANSPGAVFPVGPDGLSRPVQAGPTIEGQFSLVPGPQPGLRVPLCSSHGAHLNCSQISQVGCESGKNANSRAHPAGALRCHGGKHVGAKSWTWPQRIVPVM